MNTLKQSFIYNFYIFYNAIRTRDYRPMLKADLDAIEKIFSKKLNPCTCKKIFQEKFEEWRIEVFG